MRSRRWAVAGAVAAGIVLAYVALRPRYATAPDAPPPGADDPLNRPVLIEGGFFWKGNPDPETVSEGPFITWDESYAPETVDGFWIQEHEVTNAEYRRFDPEHPFDAGRERHPVVNVTWEEAMAYAGPRGGRLPTETEGSSRPGASRAARTRGARRSRSVGGPISMAATPGPRFPS